MRLALILMLEVLVTDSLSVTGKIKEQRNVRLALFDHDIIVRLLKSLLGMLTYRNSVVVRNINGSQANLIKLVLAVLLLLLLLNLFLTLSGYIHWSTIIDLLLLSSFNQHDFSEDQ